MSIRRHLVLLLLAAVAMPASSAKADDEPQSISAVIVRIEQRPTHEFIVTLDDGQVWQQTDRSGSMELRRGDRVVLRKAGLKSFVLVAPNGLTTRVKRIR